MPFCWLARDGYVALLNGTAVGLISGLGYFSAVIQEVRALQYRKTTGSTWLRRLASVNDSGSRVRKQPEVLLLVGLTRWIRRLLNASRLTSP